VALEDGVVSSLLEHHWRGNVRELENTIERAVVLTTGSTITRAAVTVEATTGMATVDVPSLKLRQNVEWVECETIRKALEISPLKRDAARLMGISPRALAYYLSIWADKVVVYLVMGGDAAAFCSGGNQKRAIDLLRRKPLVR